MKPALTPLTIVWLLLCLLTLLSLGLGRWFHDAGWLPLLVAAIIWLKGGLVARHFIGTHEAHPFIAWVLRIFVAFTPLALMLTVFFGNELAQWTLLWLPQR